MKSRLPYPGKYESFTSWDFRCKQWEAGRNRNQARGLSGRPKKRHIEGQTDGTIETNVRIAGAWQLVRVPMIEDFNGQSVRILKRGYGYQNAMRVRDFAEKHGLKFAQYNGNGYHGKCERTDGIAYRPI